MLIYDRFKTLPGAAMFAQAVLALEEDRIVIVTTKRLDEAGLGMLCGDSAKLTDALVQAVQVEYVFPFELTPPIVYVSRSDDDEATLEDELAQLAVNFGGWLAGT